MRFTLVALPLLALVPAFAHASARTLFTCDVVSPRPAQVEVQAFSGGDTGLFIVKRAGERDLVFNAWFEVRSIRVGDAEVERIVVSSATGATLTLTPGAQGTLEATLARSAGLGLGFNARLSCVAVGS